MEIWTNGPLTPQMALVEGAKIMRKHLNPFIQYAEPGPELALDDRMEAAAGAEGVFEELERKRGVSLGGAGWEEVDKKLEGKLGMSLAELELSVRATNCLESEGITTVRDLVIRNDDELLEVRNFGETTLTEVKQKLQERGLHLGMKLPAARR